MANFGSRKNAVWQNKRVITVVHYIRGLVELNVNYSLSLMVW